MKMQKVNNMWNKKIRTTLKIHRRRHHESWNISHSNYFIFKPTNFVGKTSKPKYKFFSLKMQHFGTSSPIYWTKQFIFSNIIVIVSGLICYRHFFLPTIDQFAAPFKIYLLSFTLFLYSLTLEVRGVGKFKKALKKGN